MKLRKLITGMTAAALALTMTVSASAATNLFDIMTPETEVAKGEKGFYDIGAMPFFMSQKWAWNEGDWVSITDEGTIKIEYSIGAPMADTTLSGKGTLGDMGIMLLNLPEDGFPYNVKISDAKFTAEDGTVTELKSVNEIKVANLDPEGGFRIHIRPTDEVDKATGEVKKKACPEVAGWEEEGKFNGGVLSMTIDLNVESTEEEAPAEEEKPAEEAKPAAEETKPAEEAKPAETAGGEAQAAQSNAQTGAASNLILAGMAMAAAGIVASKKRK